MQELKVTTERSPAAPLTGCGHRPALKAGLPRKWYRRLRHALPCRLEARLSALAHLPRNVQYPAICSHLKKQGPGLILDIGCANGDLCVSLAGSAAVIGIDRTEDPGQKYQGRLGNLRIAFARADATALPFRASSIHAVVLSSVLQMVPADSAVLAECARVLTRGGWLVLTVPTTYRLMPWFARLAAAVGYGRVSMETIEFRLRQLFQTERLGYTLPELSALLAGAGFRDLTWEYLPRGLSAVLLEFKLFFAAMRNVRLSLVSPLYLICSAAAVFDRLMPGRRSGSELLVVARAAFHGS